MKTNNKFLIYTIIAIAIGVIIYYIKTKEYFKSTGQSPSYCTTYSGSSSNQCESTGNNNAFCTGPISGVAGNPSCSLLVNTNNSFIYGGPPNYMGWYRLNIPDAWCEGNETQPCKDVQQQCIGGDSSVVSKYYSKCS